MGWVKFEPMPQAHLNQTSAIKMEDDIICPILTAYNRLDWLNLENGTDRLSRNVGKELQLHGAQQPRSADISIQSVWKIGFENRFTFDR
jgi:hypothetical protein